MENIGKIIKQERTILKISQQELAKKIGVTQDSISLWEKSKRIPDTQYIVALCKIFNISADYLLGLDEKSETKKSVSNYNIGTLNNNGKIDIK